MRAKFRLFEQIDGARDLTLDADIAITYPMHDQERTGIFSPNAECCHVNAQRQHAADATLTAKRMQSQGMPYISF